jgi:hypothetical protein
VEEPNLSSIDQAETGHGASAGHDHEPKTYNIIVNSRPKVVSQHKLTFDELIALAFDNPPTGENVAFTITYERGQGNKPEGTLLEGEDVTVKEGMIFIVTPTDRS